MELTARHSSNRIIALLVITLSVLLVLSLSATLILAVHNRQLAREQKTVVTPMAFSAPFAVSENQASASYLQMMALSFLGLRLNVSPETIDAQHQFLLSFVRPGAQPAFKVRLAEEAGRIKQNEVQSAFYQTQIKVWPAESLVTVQGVLKTWIGDGKPHSEVKSWHLKMSHEQGVTALLNFVEVSDAKL
jgi:conjugal transfer pilus assembly protein TraE